jgi:hypothetical protein
MRRLRLPLSSALELFAMTELPNKCRFCGVSMTGNEVACESEACQIKKQYQYEVSSPIKYGFFQKQCPACSFWSVKMSFIREKNRLAWYKFMPERCECPHCKSVLEPKNGRYLIQLMFVLSLLNVFIPEEYALLVVYPLFVLFMCYAAICFYRSYYADSPYSIVKKL